MAYKVVCSFKDANDKTITHTLQPSGASVTGSVVKSYMQACITNGSIFKSVPATIVGAKLVQTTETALDLS